MHCKKVKYIRILEIEGVIINNNIKQNYTLINIINFNSLILALCI